MDKDERQLFWDTLFSVKGINIEDDICRINNSIIAPSLLYKYRPISLSAIGALQRNIMYYSTVNYYDDPLDTLINIDYQLVHNVAQQVLSTTDVYD